MRSYRVGHVAGIPIEINVSLLLFAPILAWLLSRPQQIGLYSGLIESLSGTPVDADALTTGVRPAFLGIVAAVGLFASVLVHELGHAWVARRYDIPIARITLWIFGGIASLERIPREWDREFRIAIVGPLVSLGLGLACYGLVVLLPGEVPALVFLVGWLAIMNVSLALFNLLPAFPMDGGRILRALLSRSRSRSYADATRIAARVGRWMAIWLAVLGVLAFNPVLILVALFVYGAAATESRTVMLDELLHGVTAADLMRELNAVPAEESVAELLTRMLHERRTGYPVADERGRIVGVVTLDRLRGVREVERDAVLVEDVMRRGVARVEATTPAFDVLGAFGDRGRAGSSSNTTASRPGPSRARTSRGR
ncbi:site-2 protease family protein [Halalkalicoccus salilacus]|uniref:site-2 protease family protein n=1 Tax=Halalkalicoccus TaxID=332246 RepID=UPI002F96529D